MPGGRLTNRRESLRVLAVSHEASRTGAPRGLLHFLRWATRESTAHFSTLVLRDGPLREDFAATSPTRTVGRTRFGRILWTIERGLALVGPQWIWSLVARARLTPWLPSVGKVDVVYLNGIGSAEVLLVVPQSLPVVCHVHELDVAIDTLQPPPLRELLLSRPNHWIAASEAVARSLEQRGVPREEISIRYEMVDLAELAPADDDSHDSSRLRAELRISDGASVVMGSGTYEWRKGVDLFVQLANRLHATSPEDLHFVWVGGQRSGVDWVRLQADLAKVDSQRLHFIPETESPFDWYAMADVFVLTSREDPFPLVVLENGALGNPVATYRNGGIVELLESAGASASAGVAEYLDVVGLADRVLDLVSNAGLKSRASEELKSAILANHEVSRIAPLIMEDLQRVAEEAQRYG